MAFEKVLQKRWAIMKFAGLRGPYCIEKAFINYGDLEYMDPKFFVRLLPNLCTMYLIFHSRIGSF